MDEARVDRLEKTMNNAQLQKSIERYFSAGLAAIGDPSAMDVFVEFRGALERGEVRSASPDAAAPFGWRVNVWVKRGILLGFRLGVLTDASSAGFSFVDKNTYPVRHFGAGDGIRVGEKPEHGLTVGDVARIYHQERGRCSVLLGAPELAEEWKDWALRRTGDPVG